MQTSVIEDSETITKQIIYLRKIKQMHLQHTCAIRNGINSTECWCYLAGENGASLPCPKEFE